MANIFLDVINDGVLKAGNTFGTAVSSTGGLTSADMVDAIGNRMNALLTSTAIAGSGTAAVVIQESTDGTTWTACGSPSPTFDTITAANFVEGQSFDVTKRYLRGYATITGTSVTLQLTFFGQRRIQPANNGGFDNTAQTGI